ncbi:UPF0481 protein At3g47200 [Jatropha curcas]|uniref:UPF0481 protein At3g47200 n=1 Tax=Jatropha curcas TaxID=180498 RepID=UPI001895A9F6|nr:UPF0481 protein At3g47200 [Jatropha curcas]
MSDPSSNPNQQTESEGRLSPHVIVIPQTEYEIRLRSVERSTKKLPKFAKFAYTNTVWNLYSLFIPTSKGEATGSRDYQSVRPIKKLLGAGIKIKIKKDAESFLDIVFKPNGVLEIPSSPSDEFSRKFLLNSVAFEQCYYYCSIHFTSYVTFMGNLINTSFDAGYLLDRGNICTGADEDAAEFFRELKEDLFYDVGKCYLAKVIEDVNKYYRNVWNVTLAGCMYNYFGSLWVFVSAAAALFLLLLTVTQTFFAVYAYVKPPN